MLQKYPSYKKYYTYFYKILYVTIQIFYRLKYRIIIDGVFLWAEEDQGIR